jgi:hypothetical protein
MDTCLFHVLVDLRRELVHFVELRCNVPLCYVLNVDSLHHMVGGTEGICYRADSSLAL